MFGVVSGALAAIQVLQIRKAEIEYGNSLPEKEKEEYFSRMRKNDEISLQHRRNLEIAETLRPRNFWGR
jgi:hypothetical protein